MKLNIYIVLNNVSLSYAIKISKNIKNNVFFYNNRCTLKKFDDSHNKFIPLNRITYFILINIIKIYGKNFTIFIPHTKLGGALLGSLKFCEKLCLIPDGMDYYRESPKNVDLNVLNFDTNLLYLDNSLHCHASWISNFKNIIKLENYNFYSKTSINIPAGSTVIIESPGVEYLNSQLFINETVFYIKHPALGKQSKIINSNYNIIDLTKYNLQLEEFLIKQTGLVIYFGETYSAIQMLNTDLYKNNFVKLCIDKKETSNLYSYIKILIENGIELV